MQPTEMIIFAVVILAVIIVINLGSTDSKKLEAADIEITDVSFDPPSGSVLKAQTPIQVHIKFKSAHPKSRLHLWAKILEGEFDSRYEASRRISSGSGKATRYVYLNEPGEVKFVNIVIKNHELEEICNQAIPVNFVFENSEELEALSNDGSGSSIVSFKSFPPEPVELKAGTVVNIEVEYDIKAERGLDLWVIPVTGCNMTYEGSEKRLSGKGKIRKYFVVNEACELDQLVISMSNIAGKQVAEEYAEVNYRFVE